MMASATVHGSHTLILPAAGRSVWRNTTSAPATAQAGSATQTAAITAGFVAIPDDGTITPPSPTGAVGPNHVMTMTLSVVRIQDRAGGIITGDTSLDAFWAPTGATGVFAPRLLYDASASRWYATGLANPDSVSSAVLLAVSDSDDPLGAWTYYTIDADPADFDWIMASNIGLNNQWIVITGDLALVGGAPGRGATMWVIDKASALAGGPLITEFFPRRFDRTGGFNNFGLAPCVTYGPEPTLYIVDSSRILGFGVLRLSMINDDGFGTPVWSVAAGSLVAADTGLFAGAIQFDTVQVDAHQLGTTVRAETGDARIQNAVFRNGSIWCAHSAGEPVNTVSRTSVLWYQINPLGMPSPILQSNIIGANPSTHHYYPTIAVNADDRVLLTFNRSDSGRYIEAAAASRAATDALGTIGPVTAVKLGEAAYARTSGGSVAPWGPTSATVVDPVDDLGFWSLRSYAAIDAGSSPDDDRWGTWWSARDVLITGACCDGASCTDGVTVGDCQILGGTLTPGASCADPCSCPSLPAAADIAMPDAGNGGAIRYLSITPGSAGESKALRVTLSNLPAPFDVLNGRVMWVGAPSEITENPGKLLPADAPADATFFAATLRCTPYYTDFGSLGAVRVYHAAVVPGAAYTVDVIDAACAPDNESKFSTPLSVETSGWGDLVGSCGTLPCAPPDGSADVTTDVVSILDKFSNLPGAPDKARTDLMPETPNRLIDIEDVVAGLDAFSGVPYTAPVPAICP